MAIISAYRRHVLTFYYEIWREFNEKKKRNVRFWRRPRGRNDIQVISVIISVDIRDSYRSHFVFNKLFDIKTGCG